MLVPLRSRPLPRSIGRVGSAVAAGPHATLVHCSEVAQAGLFRCDAGDRLWHGDNTIGPLHHVVLALRPVEIEQDGHRSVCADRSRAVLYEPHQHYRRRLVHPDGDRAHFLAFPPEVVRAAFAVREAEPRFDRPTAVVPDALFVAQRRLFRDLRRGGLEPLRADELLLQVLDEAVAQCAPRAAPSVISSAHRDLTEDARRQLASDLGAPLSLGELGRRLHVSPYHLARVFRRVTGHSLHEHREGERLRAVVDGRLDGAAALATLAGDLGFSHHSHLTARFRRRFGTVPSAL